MTLNFKHVIIAMGAGFGRIEISMRSFKQGRLHKSQVCHKITLSAYQLVETAVCDRKSSHFIFCENCIVRRRLVEHSGIRWCGILMIGLIFGLNQA